MISARLFQIESNGSLGSNFVGEGSNKTKPRPRDIAKSAGRWHFQQPIVLISVEYDRTRAIRTKSARREAISASPRIFPVCDVPP